MKHFKTLQKQGFTLIETLIAITVLLIAIVAPMSLASEGILAARLAQDQIVAFYLAQEGVEAVRNLRDQNKLENRPMLDGALGNCIVSDPGTDPAIAQPGCYIETTNARPFSVTNCVGSCPLIRQGSNLYTYRTTSGYADTKYRRNIRAWYVPGTGNQHMRVEVTVFWPFRQTTRSYTLRNNMTEW